MDKKLDSDEVIVEIPGGEQKSKNGEMEVNDSTNIQVDEVEVQGLRSRKKGASLLSTVEISKKNNGAFTTSQQFADPKNSKLTFGEQETLPTTTDDQVTTTTSPKVSSSPSTPPRTPFMASPKSDDDDDNDDEIYRKVKATRKLRKKISKLVIIEFSLFVCITLVLIVSITMNKIADKEIWNLKLWKWCSLGLAIFCGHLFSEWLMNVVIFLIECNDTLRKTLGYYLYAARKSFRVFIWLNLILVAWVLLINRGVHNRSSDTTKVLNYISRGIASTLVIAVAWILRTIVGKFLYASFYEKRFFDRIQENIFHQYIFQALSGPPVMDFAEMIHTSTVVSSRGSNIVDVQKLLQIKRGRISAWTISMLIEITSQSGFYTYSNTLDESEDLMNPDEQNNRNVTNELEAMSAAYHMFSNVAKPGCNYIEEEDLQRFMTTNEVDRVIALIEGEVDTERINKESFFNLVVSMYIKSKFLEHSLNDINGAIKQLNKFVTGLLIVVLMIFWVILMGIVKTEVLLFISSQFLLAVFTFGSSAKSTFEAMIFVFLKHPFDVGDRCVIDGVEVVVEEVSILTSVFLRYDNEKMYYPNSELATKCISNFNRSPYMRDTVEFDLDVSTSAENISALKSKIHKYIESNLHLWGLQHSIRVREVEDKNMMKMRLYVTHTMNFQNYEEKSDRRSNLVLELKNIFEDLGIKYHILPPTSSD